MANEKIVRKEFNIWEEQDVNGKLARTPWKMQGNRPALVFSFLSEAAAERFRDSIQLYRKHHPTTEEK